MTSLETKLFAFLCQKYIQRADARQTAMGLQYTEAETHDLAAEVARFIEQLAAEELAEQGRENDEREYRHHLSA